MAWVLSDLIALMDRWTVWKEVRENANKVPELEQRIAALEQKLQRAPGEACPACGAWSFRAISSTPSGNLGTRKITYKCQECGYEDVITKTPK
jgi:predicted RNA-binding Zn-ribbon protein involved in translation (DUF1610 family)